MIWVFAVSGVLMAVVSICVALVIAFVPKPQGPGVASTTTRIALGAVPLLVFLVGIPLAFVLGRRRGWFAAAWPMKGLNRRERRILWARAHRGEPLGERDAAIALETAAQMSGFRGMAWMFVGLAVLQLVLFVPSSKPAWRVAFYIWMAVVFSFNAVVLFKRGAEAQKVTQRYAGSGPWPVVR